MNSEVKVTNLDQALVYLDRILEESDEGDNDSLLSDADERDLIPDSEEDEVESMDSSDDDDDENEWIYVNQDHPYIPVLHDFRHNSGPTWRTGNVEELEPIDYVEKFFLPTEALGNISLWEYFVRETNSYHQLLRRDVEAGIRKGTVLQDFPDDLDESQMKAFISLVINMGLNPKHRMQAYWDKSNPSQTMPIFSTVFRRKTFMAILQSFHCSDSDLEPRRGTPGYDPTYKFKTVLAHCNESWQREWNLGQNVCIDESIVGHKGHHKLICFIRIKKHNQWGPKEYNLADSASHQG